MPAIEQNPFNIPRESRSIPYSFRVTPSEKAAIKAMADKDGIEEVEVIRKGLALLASQKPANPRIMPTETPA